MQLLECHVVVPLRSTLIGANPSHHHINNNSYTNLNRCRGEGISRSGKGGNEGKGELHLDGVEIEEKGVGYEPRRKSWVNLMPWERQLTKLFRKGG
jgi:hypothetical protein